MLRNHVGALSGVVLTLAVSLFVVGCHSMTASTRDPGKKIDAVGLAVETASTQADLDKEASAIDKASRDYNSHVTEANAKLTAAGKDLAAKDEQRRQLVSLVGGLVPALVSGRAADPTLYTSAFCTLLGIAGGAGALIDSSAKSKVISRLRGNQSGDGAPNELAGGDVPAAGAPPPPVAKAA